MVPYPLRNKLFKMMAPPLPPPDELDDSPTPLALIVPSTNTWPPVWMWSHPPPAPYPPPLPGSWGQYTEPYWLPEAALPPGEAWLPPVCPDPLPGPLPAGWPLPDESIRPPLSTMTESALILTWFVARTSWPPDHDGRWDLRIKLFSKGVFLLRRTRFKQRHHFQGFIARVHGIIHIASYAKPLISANAPREWLLGM